MRRRSTKSTKTTTTTVVVNNTNLPSDCSDVEDSPSKPRTATPGAEYGWWTLLAISILLTDLDQWQEDFQ